MLTEILLGIIILILISFFVAVKNHGKNLIHDSNLKETTILQKKIESLQREILKLKQENLESHKQNIEKRTLLEKLQEKIVRINKTNLGLNQKYLREEIQKEAYKKENSLLKEKNKKQSEYIMALTKDFNALVLKIKKLKKEISDKEETIRNLEEENPEKAGEISQMTIRLLEEKPINRKEKETTEIMETINPNLFPNPSNEFPQIDQDTYFDQSIPELQTPPIENENFLIINGEIIPIKTENDEKTTKKTPIDERETIKIEDDDLPSIKDKNPCNETVGRKGRRYPKIKPNNIL